MNVTLSRGSRTARDTTQRSPPKELELDDPKNLILLCLIHHKMVDDQHETYTVEMLQQLKTNHENWVSLALVVDNQPPGVRLRRIKENIPSYLVRLTSGQDLMKIISNAGAFSFEHDEPRSEEDVESISEFLQEAHDWGDLLSDLEAGDRVKAAYRLSSSIQELEKLGYWVFGGREVQRLEGGIGPALAFPVAILRVVHSASPEVAIIDVGDDTRDTEAQITKDTGSESKGSDF